MILAMGVRRRHLNVPGEDRLAGHGVGWCAVCDGAFFRGQDVAVVGGGNTALEDALYLSGICKTVHLLVRKNEFRGQAALVQRVMEKENIKARFQTEVTEILGENKVSGITVTQNGTVETIPLSGVFVAIGLSRTPPSMGIWWKRTPAAISSPVRIAAPPSPGISPPEISAPRKFAKLSPPCPTAPLLPSWPDGN